MLWSQYKLVTIIHTEFLRKQITGIPNFANRNSNFLTLQTLEFQKNIPNGIFGIKNGIRILLIMGVPEIGTKSQNSQPSSQATFRWCWQVHELDLGMVCPYPGIWGSTHPFSTIHNVGKIMFILKTCI